MSSNTEINYEAYEVLAALASLSDLERRLSVGARAILSIKMNYSTGACAEAFNATAMALADSYQQALEMVQRSKRFLNNAKNQFEGADMAAAEFLFALHGFGQVSPASGSGNSRAVPGNLRGAAQ